MQFAHCHSVSLLEERPGGTTDVCLDDNLRKLKRIA